MGKREPIKQMKFGKLDICVQKYEIRPLLIHYTKINTRWIKNLTIRPETIKRLEQNIDENLLDISLIHDFFAITPEAQETKTKIDRWDYRKLKSFCRKKEAIISLF